jgi:UDP-N-acetylmuramoylalanine--D-glutamate ligase
MNKIEKQLENALIKARQKALDEINKVSYNREFVAEVNGVKFINDSQSADWEWAMETIQSSEKPIIWIMGQTAEVIDYNWLKTFLKGKVEAVVSYGSFSKEHKYNMEATVPFYSEHNDLDSAFDRVWSVANPEFTVVFSPACLDEKLWQSVEERGQYFNQLIKKIQ